MSQERYSDRQDRPVSSAGSVTSQRDEMRMIGLTENMIARKAKGGTEMSLQLFTVSTERP